MHPCGADAPASVETFWIKARFYHEMHPTHHRSDELPDYYDILGLPENAAFRAVEAAYWKHAFKASRSRLDLLNEAYEVLGSDQRREAYDEQRELTRADLPERAPHAPQRPKLTDRLRLRG